MTATPRPALASPSAVGRCWPRRPAGPTADAWNARSISSATLDSGIQEESADSRQIAEPDVLAPLQRMPGAERHASGSVVKRRHAQVGVAPRRAADAEVGLADSPG